MPTPPSQSCIDVRTAAQGLTNAYDLPMAHNGITVTQFPHLHALRTLDSPNLNQLATETGLDRSTLGRNIRLLTSMGLSGKISRQQCLLQGNR
jgi:DNA-binding MarR family transcriptional regulator